VSTPQRWDAIIIGAGIVGATTAYSLTKAGLSVLIVDRGNFANGTTSAGEGNILVSDKEPGPELTLALKSRDSWFEIASELGNSFELEAKGGLVVAKSGAGLTTLHELAMRQRAAGVEVNQVDSDELRTLEPHLTHEVVKGVHYPQDAQCQPMLATAHILRSVVERGGVFLQGASVNRINTVANRVTGIETSQGIFFSDIVINTAGTWAGEIAKLAGSSLPIAPRRGFILVSAPAKKLIFHKVYDADYVANVASGDADLQSSAVVEGTKSGTILIGASRERVGFKAGIDYRVLQILARQAIDLFPVLADVQLLRAYRGYRPYAPDHLPVVGQDHLISGLWHNAGHEGAGIGLAPASARLLAESITGVTTFMDATPFSPARFISTHLSDLQAGEVSANG
jgi:glycine/D-amino acid oxidase-like deaminating enzyme